MTVDVSVVVPVRNAAGTLPKLLDSLADQSFEGGYEVVIADNGSTDGSVIVAQEHPLQPRVVSEPRSGSYAARNAGLAVAQGRLVAFTDADCVAEPGWLHAGVAALEDAHLAGGRVEVLVSHRATVWERLDAGHYLDQRRNVEQEDFAATANMFARRSALEQLRGFASDLRSGGDRELCRRALDTGMRLAYAHESVVWHHPRATWRQTWQLNRRIGYSLRDLHRIGMHEPWWRDQQMVLSPRWARGTSSTPDVRTSAPTAIGVWLTVIGGRWVGRVLGR